MTKGEFETYIQSPELLNEDSIPGLQAMLTDFPYFQSAHLLLTKAYQKTENLKFDGQLKKTAAYAISRNRLHDLLFKKHQKSEEPVANHLRNEDLHSAKEEIDEPLKNSTETKKTSSESDQFIENQILSEAINNSILLEAEDEIPEIDSLSPPYLKDAKKDSSSDDSTSEPISSENVFDENKAHSFSEWLNFYSDPEETIDEDEVDEYTMDHSSDANYQLPVKHEFYSASKMARLSVQEDDDLVTETLAKIYADQGNPEKAIKAFKKLQLKYPEKRVYFAHRIKEIQNQLNS